MFVNFAREQSEDTEQDSETDSTSGGSSESIIKDPNFQRSMIGNRFAYMNPEYAAGPADTHTFDSTRPQSGVIHPGTLAFENKAFDSEVFVTRL